VGDAVGVDVLGDVVVGVTDLVGGATVGRVDGRRGLVDVLRAADRVAGHVVLAGDGLAVTDVVDERLLLDAGAGAVGVAVVVERDVVVHGLLDDRGVADLAQRVGGAGVTDRVA